MTFYTQTQCLDTLQEDEGVEGRNGGAGITQDDCTDAGDVGGSAYSISKDNAVIRWIGLCQCGELVGVSLPVELPTVNNHST